MTVGRFLSFPRTVKVFIMLNRGVGQFASNSVFAKVFENFPTLLGFGCRRRFHCQFDLDLSVKFNFFVFHLDIPSRQLL